jgi:predicted RNase H-like HicB family nuclease
MPRKIRQLIRDLERAGIPRMNDSARYVKIVEWSDEDQCFVGQCPGLIGPCCHGDDERLVYAELCQIVEEWIQTLKQDGKPLLSPTAGTDVAARILACG